MCYIALSPNAWTNNLTRTGKHNYNQGNNIAMDATPVQQDMLSDTTVDSTGIQSVGRMQFGLLQKAMEQSWSLSFCLLGLSEVEQLPFYCHQMPEQITTSQELDCKCTGETFIWPALISIGFFMLTYNQHCYQETAPKQDWHTPHPQSFNLQTSKMDFSPQNSKYCF